MTTRSTTPRLQAIMALVIWGAFILAALLSIVITLSAAIDRQNNLSTRQPAHEALLTRMQKSKQKLMVDLDEAGAGAVSTHISLEALQQGLLAKCESVANHLNENVGASASCIATEARINEQFVSYHINLSARGELGRVLAALDNAQLGSTELVNLKLSYDDRTTTQGVGILELQLTAIGERAGATGQ